MDQTGEIGQWPRSRDGGANLLAAPLPLAMAASGSVAVRPGARSNGPLLALASLSITVSALVAGFATAAEAQATAQPATPAELQQQVTELREQVRTMQEQQKGLIETVNQLRQQLASQPVPTAPQAVPPAPAPAAPTAQVAAAAPPETKEANESISQKVADRYQDGIVVWQTPNDAKVPFLMKFNVNTQVRYLNTTAENDNQVVAIISRREENLTGRSLAHGSIATKDRHFIVAKYRKYDGVVRWTAHGTSERKYSPKPTADRPRSCASR